MFVPLLIQLATIRFSLIINVLQIIYKKNVKCVDYKYNVRMQFKESISHDHEKYWHDVREVQSIAETF